MEKLSHIDWETENSTTRFRGVCGLVVGHSWHVAALLEGLGVAVLGMVVRFRDAERLTVEQTFDLAHSWT